MRACAFFTFCWALALLPMAIGQNTWQPLAGPKGITINGLATTTDGKAFIYSTHAGIFRSSDDGETWQPINDGISDYLESYNVSFAITSNNQVFFCDGYDLFLLPSNGTTWAETNFLGNNASVNQVFTNPQGDVFIVETFGAIYRSTNGGNSFSLFVPDAATEGWPGSYAFHGGGHNFASVAFGASGRIYRISDDGSQVVQVRSILGNTDALIYHESTGRVIYSDGASFEYSDNDGSTWHDIIIEPNMQFQPGVVEILETPNGDLIASSYMSSYISQDGGDTWTALGAPLSMLTGDFMLAFTPNITYAVKTGCDNANFISTTDNWTNWEVLSDKFSYPVVGSLFIDPAGNLYVQNCNSAGTERSSDGGNSWTPFPSPDGEPILRVTKNSFGHLFALTNNDILRSTDIGATWQNITPNISFLYSPELFVSPQNELYLLNDIDAYKSNDNGNTWEALTLPQALPYHTGAAFHPDGSFYIATEFSGIWRSNDGWQTWEQVYAEQADVYNMHINSKGHIYFNVSSFINNNSGLHVSYDGLNSYQLISPSYFPISIVSDAEGDIYMVTGNDILYSEDDGMTWQELNNGLPHPEKVSSLYLDDDQYLYACQYGDVIYKTSLPVAEKNTVRGKVWFDENENCQLDPGEQPLSGWLIKADGNGTTYHRSTGFDGSFILGLPQGDFSVNSVMPNTLWENTCTPQGVNVTFSTNGDTAFVDFPIAAAQLCPMLTADISTPLLRRCFDNTYNVKVCNEGTANASNVTVEVVLDSLLLYQSATVPLLSQNGNTYTFSVGDLGIEDCYSFQIIVNVSCEAELGQTHCVEATLLQANCATFPAWVAKECQENIGSFDPNDKTALVGGLPANEWVNPNTDLEYHIRFQNTGTDTAFTVVVEDQLSTLLDPATFRPGASSHPYSYEMTENGKLRFIFNNIMLPDSNINEAASHGFVKFAVSQRSDVPLGSYINNFAAIFFDFNEPVLTNTVELHVGNPTATIEREPSYTVLAFPNPFENNTHLKINGLDGSKLQMKLFDSRGVMLHNESFVAPEMVLQRNGLIPGMYFFSIEKEGNVLGRGKLVIKQ